MKRFIIEYIENLEQTVSVLGDVLYKTFSNENGLISDEGRKILDNDVDRKSVEKAVDYLKKHSEVQNKEVELSDKRKILISIG